MKIKYLLLLILTLTALLTATVGCSTRVVRVSLSPIPQEVKGVLYVQTNSPIPVGIEGTDEVLRLDVGGYYLIHKDDLAAMIRRLKGG
jgi:hypothetical protein